MATVWNQSLIHYRDHDGGTATVSITNQNQTAAADAAAVALGAACQALSVARVFAVQTQTTTLIGGDPSEGPYGTVWDRCKVATRREGRAGIGMVAVVAPKAAIWLPGHQVLDMSNELVVAFVEALRTYSGDPDGNAVTGCPYGRRSMQKPNTLF